MAYCIDINIIQYDKHIFEKYLRENIRLTCDDHGDLAITVKSFLIMARNGRLCHSVLVKAIGLSWPPVSENAMLYMFLLALRSRFHIVLQALQTKTMYSLEPFSATKLLFFKLFFLQLWYA